MSIPVNLLRYGGVWNNTTAYSQYVFVESPIDTFCYIYVGVPDIVGGTDPSVASALWVLLPAPSSGGGGITSLNGLTDPAMSIVGLDSSIKIAPVSPDEVNISRWGYIPYGSFSSTQTQPCSAGVPLPLVYDTKDIASTTGINVLVPSSEIIVSDAGVYKVLSSIQCDSTVALQTLTGYVSVNGTPVDNSSTRVIVNVNLESLMTVEWFLGLNPNDRVEVVLYDPVGGGQAVAFPAVAGPPIIPAVPSVITTILRIA